MAKMTLKRVVDVHDAIKERVEFFQERKENKLVAKSVLLFANVYCKFVNTQQDVLGVDDVLTQWKKEFSLYTSEGLSLKQKINFFLFKNFPKFKWGLTKVKKNLFNSGKNV